MFNSFVGAAAPLTQAGLDRALERLGAEAPDLWSVLTVETRGCGFLANRRPLILFERHIFRRRTGGLYDATHPSISSSTPGGYFGGIREYGRFEEALALDRTAALESTSWGIGQVMGFNSTAAGFPSADEMVTAMAGGEDAQLSAMANFLCAHQLHEALADHDWVAFARGYNGPDFARNQYAERLLAAFSAFSNGPLPDLNVRQAQVLLMFLGVDAGAVDGILGKRTRSGIRQFKERSGLPPTDDIDDTFLAALTAAVHDSAIAGS
jgi:hypothetical protein